MDGKATTNAGKPTKAKPRRKMFWIAAGVVVVVLLAVLLVPLLYVDDWSRDLTTNHAATSADAADEALRPIRTGLSAAETAKLVEGAAAGLPRWEPASRREKPGGAVVLSFVRTTPLMRYKDDITVTVSPTDGGSRITAESRSRVGKGDLGQNPRNLKELLGAVRQKLDAAQPATGQ